MARLIPKVSPDEIQNAGERDIARALVKQLPDDVVIYHSYPWLRSERNDKSGKVTLREGEADFVVVHPNAGMLILEVKGGEIVYDNANRAWYRHEPHRVVEIKDPFEQARRNAHCLEQSIRKEMYRNLPNIPFPYGYAVAFPHCDYDGGVPPGADTSMVFSASDLPYLGQRITKLLGNWKHSSHPVKLSKQDMDGVQLALSPSFQLLPVLYRQLQEQEERLLRMTEEQVRLLDFLSTRDRAAIQGVAGSGKTLLGMAQAQKFARRGLKTLFVCYNKPLAEYLEESVPQELANLVKVDTFHGLCAEYCRKAHVQFTPTWDDAGEFWKHTATELFIGALDLLPDRFDAVVVDEGQDFYSDWWIALEMINKGGDKGPFYIFYDPAQNLFVSEDLAIPNLGQPFSLPTNCRNTRQIADTCSKIRGVDIPIREDAPEGVKTIVRCQPDAVARANSIRQLVDEWTSKGKLQPSQIAILSPFEKSKTCLSEQTKIGRTPLCTNPNEWRANKGILLTTIRRFKGLEADAIIVTDVPDPEIAPYFTLSDFYVGCSRAKHILVVLSSGELSVRFMQ